MSSLRLFFLASVILSFGACSEQSVEEAQVELTELARFGIELRESSGLARHGGAFWLINDSGNEPTLYELEESGEIRRAITVSGVDNRDWESLAHDEEFLYIAETGNNLNRWDAFTIYRVRWRDLESDTVDADSIIFTYGDYRSGSPRSHNFDSEALTVRGAELWLFTKNRGDGNTNLYRFPKVPGHYSPKPSQSFNLGSLVTAADIHPATGQLALLSHESVFGGNNIERLWLAPTTEEGVDTLQLKAMRILPIDQWEAVLWSQDGQRLFFSHERSQRRFAGMAKLEMKELES
ncbi:MAG: SdiA-regulated domain-containing protein, partial [Gammaproteobacteria bacterium]|nr:SdiA-regulated domain-containing protein [Gammaproteobacteria bacterium]